MNNEIDLQRLWQQGHSWQTRIHPRLVQEIKAELGKMYTSIKTRNRNEQLAAAFVIPVFLLLGYFMENPFARLGAWFVSAYGVWVMVIMSWIASQRPQQDLGVSFYQQLQQEITYFKKEKRLLGLVIWWYILPCLIGLGLFHWGLSSSWISFVIMMAGTLLLMGYIYTLNRDAVNKKINPLLAKLEQLEKELES